MSVYTTCIVSYRPQLTTPSCATGTTVSVSTIVSRRKIPVVSPFSVRMIVSVSSTNPSALIPIPLPTYTVTDTVSRICGFRFSSVSVTCTYIWSRVWYVSTTSTYPPLSYTCTVKDVDISSASAASAALSPVPVPCPYFWPRVWSVPTPSTSPPLSYTCTVKDVDISSASAVSAALSL